MARNEWQILTEPMFYILLVLQTPRSGVEISTMVQEMTDARVQLPPGTLYALLGRFEAAGFIAKVDAPGREKKYIVTEKGKQKLVEETQRLAAMLRDFTRLAEGPLE